MRPVCRGGVFVSGDTMGETMRFLADMMGASDGWRPSRSKALLRRVLNLPSAVRQGKPRSTIARVVLISLVILAGAGLTAISFVIAIPQVWDDLTIGD